MKGFCILSICILCVNIFSQSIISKSDFKFLKEITQAVLDCSRIQPGQMVTKEAGTNNTGSTVIKPGGRDAYPYFWIRDLAMIVETDMLTNEEILHAITLTANTQCEQTWITQRGSYVPFGAIADHIRMDDGKPIYFPGTSVFEDQGNQRLGMMPPYGDQFYFTHMVYYYIQKTNNIDILQKLFNDRSLLDRIDIAFHVPPSRDANKLVYTIDEYRAVDFGFRDVISITGDLCFASLIKYRTAMQLSDLYEKLNNADRSLYYSEIAQNIKQAIPKTFMDSTGMLKASNNQSAQHDVWATAWAVYLGVLNEKDGKTASQALLSLYKTGQIEHKGHIRHVPLNGDFNETTAWEKSYAPKNTYQNGAYWAVPVGWVAYALAKVDIPSAQKLTKDFIQELNTTDFRKGMSYAGPYECFHPNGHKQNPIYLTSVACPYIVFKNWK